jgi:dolichol-phosphate mannosyltransferase
MDISGKAILSIVIPVFNEEESIPALQTRLRSFLATFDAVDTEVIFVDDHSTDRTQAKLKTACNETANFRYIRLAANSGSHVAVLAGLRYARGDCAVFLAADLQDPPELIPKMLALWRQGNHVVWAVREERKGVSFFEKFFANAFYWLLIHVARVAMPPTGSDFALLDRKVIDALLESAGACPSLCCQIARLGFVQTHIPYTKEARQFGETKWNLRRKLVAFADAFVGFSYVPLRAMAYLGIACSLSGFGYAVFIIVHRIIFGGGQTGWPSLMVVVLLIGGIQMTMLGVLGEYLWRTLEEARRRPNYFIEDQTGKNAEPS